MNLDNNVYSKILKAHNDTYILLKKRNIYFSIVMGIFISLYLIVLLYSSKYPSFFQCPNIILGLMGIVTGGLLYLYDKKNIKNFDMFLNNRKFQLVGNRAFLFFEKIENINYLENKDLILKTLDEDIKYEDDFLKSIITFCSLIFSICYATYFIFINIVNEYFLVKIKKFIFTGEILFLLSIIVIICILFSYSFVFKTSKRKLEELKLFLHWYEVIVTIEKS